MSVEGVDRVRNFIKKYGIKAEILEFKESVESVSKASKVSGFPSSKILKTIVIIADEKPYIVILPGDRKLDFKKLRDVLNVRKIRLANSNEVEELLNIKPGEVSPFLDEVLKYKIILDKSAVDKDEVVVGGGSIYHLVRTYVNEIIKVLKPEIEDISKTS